MAKFDNVTVKLIGEDGNAMAIIGRVSKAMKRAGINQSDIDAYTSACFKGDYDNVLRVTVDTVKFE
jgi:hypothetical protein